MADQVVSIAVDSTNPTVDVASVEMPRTRKALMASDHLPLVANFKIG